jgi:hypothetical protein
MHNGRDKHRHIKKIETTRELGVWLFNWLDAGTPRIPVKLRIIGAKLHLLHQIKASDEIISAPAYYVEILEFIRWDVFSGGTDGTEMCGKALLDLMGEMSESMKRHEVLTLPVSRAVEMMIDIFNNGAGHLRYGHRGKHWWIESTSAFERRYRVAVRVDLPKPSPDVWDLRTLESDFRSPRSYEGAYFTV